MAIFVILSISSYIIYSGVEDEAESEVSETDEDAEENDGVQDDEHLREMAIPQDDEEEKED